MLTRIRINVIIVSILSCSNAPYKRDIQLWILLELFFFCVYWDTVTVHWRLATIFSIKIITNCMDLSVKLKVRTSFACIHSHRISLMYCWYVMSMKAHGYITLVKAKLMLVFIGYSFRWTRFKSSWPIFVANSAIILSNSKAFQPAIMALRHQNKFFRKFFFLQFIEHFFRVV